MARSAILISGLGDLGVEITKFVVLSGVKPVPLHDTKTEIKSDLSTQYFLREKHIGKNRTISSKTSLSELNNYVSNFILDKDLNDENSKLL